MSRNLVVALLFVTHAAMVGVLSWPQLWPVGLDVVLLLFAASGALPPTPTTSPRHRDVAAAERTALGQHLLNREFWRVSRAPLAAGLLVLVWAVSAATFLALRPTSRAAEVIAWTPVVLLAVGAIAQHLLTMWLVTVPMLGLWLVALVASALDGRWDLTALVLAGAAGLAASIFSSDLLKRLSEPPPK